MATRSHHTTWLGVLTLAGVALLVAYVGLYIVLSAMGTPFLATSGRHHFPSGGDMPDSDVWVPLGTRRESSAGAHGQPKAAPTFLGHLYAPLIHLDHAYWHPPADHINAPSAPAR